MGKKSGKKKAKKTLTDEEKLLAAEQAVGSPHCVRPPPPLLKLLPQGSILDPRCLGWVSVDQAARVRA